MPRISAVTLVVRDYDEPIAWFTGVLGFVLLEDTRLSDTCETVGPWREYLPFLHH